MRSRRNRYKCEQAQRASINVDILQFADPIAYLRQIFTLAQRHSSEELGKYSYADFSEELGFGRTTYMHQVLNGRRKLTPKAADRIAMSIDLKGVAKDCFLLLVAVSSARSAAERQSAFDDLLRIRERLSVTSIDQDMIAYLSNWYHPVVWELVDICGNSDDPVKQIHRRLSPRVDERIVRQSVELLKKLGLVTVDTRTGGLKRVKERISTGHRASGIGLRAYHRAMMNMAIDCLQRGNTKRQDFSALTVRISDEGARRVRALIHEFQLKILDECERAEDGEHVYQMNIQLFPFTE